MALRVGEDAGGVSGEEEEEDADEKKGQADKGRSCQSFQVKESLVVFGGVGDRNRLFIHRGSIFY